MSDYLVIEGMEVPIVPGSRLSTEQHGDFGRAFSLEMRSDSRGETRTAQVQTGEMKTADMLALEALMRSPGKLLVSGGFVGAETYFHVRGFTRAPQQGDGSWWTASFELHESAVQASPLLFSWKAEAPGPEDFARASTAFQVTKAGKLESVASGVRRTNWRESPDGVLVPVAPVAVGRTNVLWDAANFADTGTAWTNASDFTVTEVSSYLPGQSAWRHVNGGSGGSRQRSQIRGTLGSSPTTASTILENVDAVLSHIGIYDNTVANWVVRGEYDWSTGVFTASDSGAGSSASVRAEVLKENGPNGGVLVRLEVTATPNNSGNDRRVIVYPSGITTNTETAIIHHAQCEVGSFATSPVVTPDDDGATRPVETLALPYTTPPGPVAIYSRIRLGYDGLGGLDTNARIWHIGAAADTGHRIHLRTDSATSIRVLHSTGAVSSGATVSGLTLARDKWLECVVVQEADASGRLIVLTEGGSPSGADLAAVAGGFGAEWSDELLHIGNRGGTSPSSHEHQTHVAFDLDVIESATDGTADAALLTECGNLARARLHPRTVF